MESRTPPNPSGVLPIYLFSASFSAFAGWKLSFLAAATLTVAPVDGLRASPLIKTQEP
jgi:hypothetical protein